VRIPGKSSSSIVCQETWDLLKLNVPLRADPVVESGPRTVASFGGKKEPVVRQHLLRTRDAAISVGPIKEPIHSTRIPVKRHSVDVFRRLHVVKDRLGPSFKMIFVMIESHQLDIRKVGFKAWAEIVSNKVPLHRCVHPTINTSWGCKLRVPSKTHLHASHGAGNSGSFCTVMPQIGISLAWYASIHFEKYFAQAAWERLSSLRPLGSCDPSID